MITCVAGTASSPRREQTYFSTAGSMLENVPTAPESLPTAIDVRAWRARSTSRWTCKANSANFAPKVVGSACIPWVRPVIGMSIESTARRVSASRSAIASVITMSMACVRVAHRAVSTTSEDVKP